MITQIQTTEQQTAILAVCPRPRALACAPAGSFVATRVSAEAGARWSSSVVRTAASVRRPDSVLERPATAHGVTRVLVDAVRTEAGSGIGEAGTLMSANGAQQQYPQDKQHLTARREPVTWRPPH